MSTTILGPNNFELVSNGIPDHNSCAATPNVVVEPQSYKVRIPLNPVQREGDTSTFSATNMGAIGYATNGVPIFNPYDSRNGSIEF